MIFYSNLYLNFNLSNFYFIYNHNLLIYAIWYFKEIETFFFDLIIYSKIKPHLNFHSEYNVKNFLCFILHNFLILFHNHKFFVPNLLFNGYVVTLNQKND